MPKGEKKAKVHEVFKNRLSKLTEWADKAYKAFQQSEQRPWCIPDDLGADDLFKIAKLHEQAYDREEANTNYLECFQDASAPGTTGDVIALKHQIDYVASEERAFRFRHASACRCITAAMGRRCGEGIGPTFPFIEETVSDVIAAGAAE